ncbi:MAG: 2OG-Fe(II) oxygenase [Rhodobacteraceae bacterium]|nr:2OG-Fe(II) oxygenase [Paracoccaceae bacterium]
MKQDLTIPIIDIAKLTKEQSEVDLQLAIFEAYHDFGFAYIVNHGIDPVLVDTVFDASKRFHKLPKAEKMKVALDHKHRGYIAINTSTDVNSKLARVKKPNQSASFMMMREDTVEDPNVYLSGPNQWPELENFREALEAYSEAMEGLGRRLLELSICSAGATDLSVLSAFDRATIWLRLLYYPPVSKETSSDVYGSAPHTDFGCLTLLAQDNVGGLQVQSPTGQWLDAPKIENSFIVNVGDMLHRMTNGKLRSTPHRVINRSGKERYSCPFFYDPHVSLDVAPLAGTGAPRFKTLNFGDFLKEELEASYIQHKTLAT